MYTVGVCERFVDIQTYDRYLGVKSEMSDLHKLYKQKATGRYDRSLAPLSKSGIAYLHVAT